MENLGVYIPMDRRHALIRGEALPDRAQGVVLFADICGFTPLTESLARAFGPRRGAEELTRQLNRIYDALIAEVDRYGGSVINFSGDAITCWFNDDRSRFDNYESQIDAHCSTVYSPSSAALCAVACALMMQQAIAPLAAVALPYEGGRQVALGIKVAVASGSVRRFLIGDPTVQLVDVLAGATLARMAAAEHLTNMGEVTLDTQTVDALDTALQVGEWRVDPATGERFALARGLIAPVASTPWPHMDANELPEAQARSWLLPAVYARLQAGQGEYLTELRPAVAVFVRFDGIDYDGDDAAGAKLDAYVRWSQEVLAHYKGVLMQLTIGDKGSYLYAAFGAPNAHEGDTRRAVAAARELSLLPPTLAFISGVQIGVSKGTMRTGAYGSVTHRTYGVLGDEVNLAARLMQAALPGQVLASARVATATANEFVWESLPPIAIKGKAKLVSTARLAVDSATTVARDRRYDGMIGRVAERMLLNDLLDALRDPHTKRSAIVVIEGEAGIGKSRLVRNLWDQARTHGLMVLTGAGDAIEQTTPYQAWRSVFGQLFGLGEITDPEAQRQRVQDVLATLLNQSHLAPLFSSVLPFTLPDNEVTAQLTGQARVDQTRELLIQLLQEAAREAPMVLSLEDTHWLDSASWALALEVSQQVRPLMFVITTRPLDHTPPAEYSQLLDLPEVRRLQLDTLSSIDTLALVRQQLGVAVLPEQAATLIVEKSQGNPFFSEELAFALRDAGLLIIDNGVCELAPEAGNLRELDFPDTVQGVITSRIDRLTPSQQMALKVASVIGRLFAFKTLYDIYPMKSELVRLDTDLRTLDRLDLTREDATDPDLAYLFKHIITQEVAYNLMLFAQRHTLHRAVAEWYERTFEDLSPFYPVLAHHWSKAEVIEKAVEYLEKAAAHTHNMGLVKESVAFGLEGARLLGVDLPTDPSAIVPLIGTEMAEIQHLMAERKPADLINLPQLTDPTSASVIGILHEIMPAAHNSLQTALFALMVLKNVSLTLQHGNGPLAPDVYSLYSAALHAMTGDSRLAYEFSRLALDLDASQGGLRTASASFLHVWFINHWVNPLETSLEICLEGSRAGFEHGDLIYGCFNTASYVITLNTMGAPLEMVIDVAIRHGQIIDNRVASAAFHCLHELQIAKALAGQTINRVSFTDDQYDEERDVASICQTANYHQITYYLISKLKLHYYYQEYAAALDYADKALPMFPAFQGQTAEMEFVFFYTLVLLARSTEVDQVERRDMIGVVQANVEKLAGWSAVCAANFEHKLLLAQAELARVEGRFSDALHLYSQAVRSAEMFNYIQHAALAHELAGRCYLDSGDHVAARQSIEAAVQGYASWGAWAKVEHLSKLLPVQQN